jgi:hypothetical protein
MQQATTLPSIAEMRTFGSGLQDRVYLGLIAFVGYLFGRKPIVSEDHSHADQGYDRQPGMVTVERTLGDHQLNTLAHLRDLPPGTYVISGVKPFLSGRFEAVTVCTDEGGYNAPRKCGGPPPPEKG